MMGGEIFSCFLRSETGCGKNPACFIGTIHGTRLRLEPLEDRTLLSVALPGTEFLVNQTTGGNQALDFNSAKPLPWIAPATTS